MSTPLNYEDPNTVCAEQSAHSQSSSVTLKFFQARDRSLYFFLTCSVFISLFVEWHHLCIFFRGPAPFLYFFHGLAPSLYFCLRTTNDKYRIRTWDSIHKIWGIHGFLQLKLLIKTKSFLQFTLSWVNSEFQIIS